MLRPAEARGFASGQEVCHFETLSFEVRPSGLCREPVLACLNSFFTLRSVRPDSDLATGS